MNHKTILLVEDEPKILDFTKSYLENEGFNVLIATTGKIALSLLEENTIDLILLDLMLPDLSGEEICKKTRLTSSVPIIMVTAKGDDESIVEGLKLGADDYVVKPFSPRQLVARVKALFRRVDDSFRDGNDRQMITFNYDQYAVFYKDNNLELTKTEFLILYTLARRSSKIFTREELADQVYNGKYEGYIRSMDSHIKNIRLKISSYTNHDFIKTIRGIGYQFMNLE